MDDSMMKKIMDKKGGKGSKLSDTEREAKMSVLEDLRKMMEDQMGGHLDGLKKVTVASPDQHGLEKGLETAQELISHAKDSKETEMGHGAEENEPSHDELDESSEEEASESPEMEASEDEDDEASIDAKLAELMAKKKAMSGKKLY
jgi:hypothetical protein